MDSHLHDSVRSMRRMLERPISSRGHTRRMFLAAALAGVAAPWEVARAARAPSADEQRGLEELLRPKDKTYDPFARMLVAPAQGGPDTPSHRHGDDVHPVRLSLSYAAVSLEMDSPWRRERARDILRVVLSLQDTDPVSPTYGTWPWYLEEPLPKMAFPDPTLAESCAATLLMIWSGNRKALGTPLEGSVAGALGHAARSIQQRHEAPAHTSAAVMGTGVTLVTAQELRLPELRRYARERLRAFYEAAMRVGWFAEYNSPSQTLIVLQELSRMLLLVRDGRDRALVSALHDLAWKQVATHFHPPTQQWAGPHSHCDETNLAANKAALAFLQKACQGKASFHHADPLNLSLDAARLPLACPRKWSKTFATLGTARQVVERFLPADSAKADGRRPLLGTTWLHPRFTLGSVNRGDFSAHRRPLLAYWGTASVPRFLRARFLQDGHDLGSALFISAQHQGYLLGAVIFATDRGAAPAAALPAREPEFRARELKFSLEMGGALGRCTMRALQDEQRTVVIQDDEIRWAFRSVTEGFDGAPFVWEQPSLKLATAVSATAYRGEEKAFKMGELRDAFFCFTLAEWPYEQKQPPPSQVQGRRQDGRLQIRWVAGGKGLELEIPTRPGPSAELNEQSSTAVVLA